ncbi:phosphate/phosphite/phosphonate ABC transporter substrate-binding protein [Halothiobacillus sp.]|uniref:phosphate/phosphite/phosphonate ABC transporter substrate-binding protein n=1 Tax=Halothiobacillus sp. TaxID=1891311 RepID=UPI002AD2F3DA|nr:phosphate/phosphite/phosphonate ABC transporter substrate-binding protein [Halothiobacillus sp.]
MIKTIFAAIFWMLGLAPLYAAEQPIAQAVYSFGIGPREAASELAKRWVPVLRYLSEKSGYTLQFTTAKDIPTFQGQMKEGSFDLAFINPYHYTMFHERIGYEAFAHERDGKLTGIVVVRKDSPIQSMAELNNQTVAFPAATALAATVLPMAYFGEQRIHATPNYVVSMDSVYRSVAKGFFPAGGGELRTFNTLDPEVRNQLRILWTAEALPPFTFAAHPRVPKAVVAKIQKAMHDMDRNPQGAELLKTIKFKGIDPTDDSYYDGMRKLNLKMPGESSPVKN